MRIWERREEITPVTAATTAATADKAVAIAAVTQVVGRIMSSSSN